MSYGYDREVQLIHQDLSLSPCEKDAELKQLREGYQAAQDAKAEEEKEEPCHESKYYYGQRTTY
jgi:hypothetical protein